MMDAAQCARSLWLQEERPRLAGREYALVPVETQGVFHTKMVMLAGTRRSLLLVGSHNTTIAGFGVNRELTNVIDVRHDSDPVYRATLRDAWEHLRGWTNEQPAPIARLLDAFEHHLQPFARDLQREVVGQLEASAPTGDSLWDRCRRRLRGRVRRVTVVGPFFDAELRFLKRIVTDLAPESLIVGIESATASIRAQAASNLVDARFVDVTDLGERTGYLHAKAICIEMTDGLTYLITGSANPSSPAWLDGSRRNAEAVVNARNTFWDSLGGGLGSSGLLEPTADQPAVVICGRL